MTPHLRKVASAWKVSAECLTMCSIRASLDTNFYYWLLPTRRVQMLRRAVKNGFIAKYLLMDKWYFGKDLIKEVRRIKDGAIHVITLLKKKDTRFTVDGKLIPATSLKEPWLMKRRNMT